MNSKIIIIAVVVILILGAGAFLLTKNSANQNTALTPTPTSAVLPTDTPVASPSEAMEQSSPSGTVGVVKEFTVTGTNFKFAPATLTVKKGDTVKITFKNEGGFHNFLLDEFNVATKTVSTGQSETVTFVADKAGTFEYYCGVGNHRQMGMVGTLTVQ